MKRLLMIVLNGGVSLKIFDKAVKSITWVTSKAVTFRESELAYVDGHFAATILLVIAIIERMLQGWLYENGYKEESRKGIGKTLKLLRRHDLLHVFILDEIDKLRRKRNHFAHFKTDDEEMRVDMRIVATKIYDPHALMQIDAEFSLRLLHHLYGTRLGKIKISS